MYKEKFIDYLRYEKNYSSLTEIAYFKDISQFEDFLKSIHNESNLSLVDSEDIRMWISSLIEQNIKPSSVNRKLSALKSFFKYLKKKRVVDINPAETVTGPKTTKRLPAFITEKEMIKILDDEDNYTDDFSGIRNKLIIELFYVTGIRLSELIGLKDNDIDLNTCSLSVIGKRNKQRMIPFSEYTKNKIKHYLEGRDAFIKNKSSFLFVREDGEQMSSALVYSIIKTHLNCIPTLSKKSPHVLRHTFATVMLNNGAEINAIKEILGHSSLASTEVYTHVTFEEMKKTYHIAHPRAKK